MTKKQKFKHITVEEAIALWELKVPIWYTTSYHKQRWQEQKWTNAGFNVWAEWEKRFPPGECRLKVEVE